MVTCFQMEKYQHGRLHTGFIDLSQISRQTSIKEWGGGWGGVGEWVGRGVLSLSPPTHPSPLSTHTSFPSPCPHTLPPHSSPLFTNTISPSPHPQISHSPHSHIFSRSPPTHPSPHSVVWKTLCGTWDTSHDLALHVDQRNEISHVQQCAMVCIFWNGAFTHLWNLHSSFGGIQSSK